MFLGYFVEAAYRILVYEYVDYGNLDQWLHAEVGDVSPLTWEIRVNVIIRTVKGLPYLHDGLEPKVVHCGIKSSNTLLDANFILKLDLSIMIIDYQLPYQTGTSAGVLIKGD